VPAPQKPDQQKEAFTAWGKEINGLQAGVGFRAGEKRAYAHGETVTLVVRVRNVGKEAVKFEYVKLYLDETPPTETDADACVWSPSSRTSRAPTSSGVMRRSYGRRHRASGPLCHRASGPLCHRASEPLCRSMPATLCPGTACGR